MFDHEKLDVYRISIEFNTWVFNKSKVLTGFNRFARDQLIRAGQSISLNIAEGNGKRSIWDRCRFFEIARGSTFECASILDLLLISNALNSENIKIGKQLLYRIACILTKMTEKNNLLQEEECVTYESY